MNQPFPDHVRTTSSSSSAKANQKSAFKVVDIVEHPDGVFATITERDHDGRISFSIERKFDKGGESKTTKFLSRRHLPAVQQLLSDLAERLETLEDKARARRRR